MSKQAWIQVGYELLTVSSSAVGCTAAISSDLGATRAVFGPPLSGGISWRADGTDPTATNGHICAISTAWPTPTEFIGDLTKLKFIRATIDTTLPVTYFKLM